MTAPSMSLRLLGGVALEREDGTLVTGRAAQKRRLALLALLALAPGRCLSRDRLLAYLWPESDTEQARHLLAVAIYELRKALGEDVIHTRGDELELSDALVRTDVREFEAAAREQRWDNAAELYRGPLLDGFFIGEASEFEHWVDAERERLARLFASTLESLGRARAREGDAAGALDAWRRRAVLDPYNSRVARELMAALEAAGDRAGAIRHARVHAILLREEFAAEPDPEIEQYAKRLRTMPAADAAPEAAAPGADPVPEATSPARDARSEVASSAGVTVASGAARPSDEPQGTPQTVDRRPSLAVVPTGRRHVRRRRVTAGSFLLLTSVAIALLIWNTRGRAHAADCSDTPSIAVFPFLPLAPAEEHTYVGDMLAEELLNALGRLECLQVVPRTASFEFRESDVPNAARRLEVSHSLSGAWMEDAGWLIVHARLIETGSRREIWSQKYERMGPWTPRDMAEVQQEIATAVVDELSMRLAAGAEPLVRLRTDNAQASQALYLGRRSLERRTVRDMLTAQQLFSEAVKLDPDFADAHAAVAEVTALLGAYDYGLLHPRAAYRAALNSARQALAGDSLLAEAHATLGSVYFNHFYEWERADSAFRRAIEVKRGYSQSYHWYALLLAARGRTDEARSQLEQGLEYDRNSIILRTALSRNHYFARDFQAAIRGYQAVLASDSLFLTAHLGLGLAYTQISRYDDAVAAFRRAERIIGQTLPVLHGLLGYAEGRAGRLDAAREHLQLIEQAAAMRYVPAEYFALVHIGLGDIDAALSYLERAHENGSGGIAYLAIEPVLDPLRHHPRFTALERRVRLQ